MKQTLIPWPTSVARACVALGLAAALACAALPSCRAKEEQLYDPVFACDARRPSEQCGSTRDGKPMTCFAGHVLEGQDFCAPRCDPSQAPADDRFICLSSGALVQRCRPARGAADPSYTCPTELSCYRTDLLQDEGICLMMDVCNGKGDCGGPSTECAADLVRDVIAGASDLATDSLQCIRTSCSEITDCPADQGCLPKVYSLGTMLPDICVPMCENAQCPPNFACARREDWAPGTPPVCVPGVPGVRCNDEQDCVIGSCLDTGAGFRVCTLDRSCRPVDFCAQLDSPADVFVCAEGIPGRPRCVTPRPFAGANCRQKEDCPAGSNRECIWYSLSEASPMHGDCRLRCGADGRCQPQGGIPFFCAGENGEGGCQATQFGAPCVDDSECFETLSCLRAGPDERSRTNYTPFICTLRCEVDAECDANHLTFHGGFCQAGFCRLAGAKDAPCTRNAQCRSRLCGPGATCLE